MIELDHYSIRTLELDKVKNFFHDLLRLETGFHPNFNFPEDSLYVSDPKQAVVHLVGHMKDSSPLDIGENTGADDHNAFQGDIYGEIIVGIK